MGSTFVATLTNDINTSYDNDIHPADEPAFDDFVDLNCVDNFFVLAFLSQAEQALRHSSGQNFLTECWGWSGVAKYHNQHFHCYRDCPNQNDPDVKAHATQKANEWRE